MRRVFPVFVLLSLPLAAALGLAPIEEIPAPTPRPKRVLFRTESPRLFAPKSGAEAKPTPVPAVARATPPPTSVRVPQKRPAQTASIVRSERPRQPAPLAIPAATPRLRVTPPTLPQMARLETHARPPTVSRPADPPVEPRFQIDFQPTTFTPYDRYMGTVRSVMARLDEHNASMIDACELVRECRNFRYAINDLYRADPPAVTEARRAGDCKSKALWVYDHLGDPSAYYVIGKLVQRSRTSHAWVYWRNNGRWWILDPTIRSTPIAADSVSSERYVPYYSYSRAGAFRHSATRLMMASNGIPAVMPTTGVRARTIETRASATPR